MKSLLSSIGDSIGTNTYLKTNRMAEYPSEFNKLRRYTFSIDFSVIDIFLNLKEGQSYDIICEGFGFHKIKKTNEKCRIKLRDRDILFEEFFNQFEI